MKQQEVKKELKLKAAKAGGKVTPVTGEQFLPENEKKADFCQVFHKVLKDFCYAQM